MKYTAEKLVARQELLNSKMHIFTDEILSFIAIDEREMVRHFEGNMLISRWNLTKIPRLHDYIRHEWKFLEQFGITNFSGSLAGAGLDSIKLNFFDAITESIVNLDMDESAAAILDEVEMQNKNMKILMRRIIENGKCVKVFNVVKKKLSSNDLYRYFQETYVTQSLDVLKIFIHDNPQYGYFIHNRESIIIFGRRVPFGIYFYVGLRSKIFYMC